MSIRFRLARLCTPLGWGAAAALYFSALIYGALWWAERPMPTGAPEPSASARPIRTITHAPRRTAPAAQKSSLAARRTPAAAATRPKISKGSTAHPIRKAKSGVAARAAAVAYRKVVAAGVPMHVVQIDLSRPEVRIAVATARDGIGYRDTWPALIDRTRPIAAITGTYFDVRTAVPVGSIIVGGQTVHRGGVGTAFTYTPGRGARLVACRPGIGYGWSGFDTVLRAGPRLLTGGARTLWPHAEGFRDPAVFARKRRTAVAITRSGKLLLVAVQKPVLLRTLAGALQRIGAVDAMCLDGGSSAGLYHRGKSHVVPRRSLTNLLVIYDSTARYQQQAPNLNPSGPALVQVTDGPTAG